jgi:hypothetical protein
VFLTSVGDSQAKVTLFREIWRVTLSKWHEAWQGGIRSQDGGQYSRLSFVDRFHILNRYVKLLVKQTKAVMRSNKITSPLRVYFTGVLQKVLKTGT